MGGHPLRAVLDDTTLEQSWAECLATWEEATGEQIADVFRAASGLRELLVAALTDVDASSGDDAARDHAHAAAVAYLYLRAHWTLLNLRINHRMTAYGDCDPALLYQGSLVSALLAAVEPHLPADVVGRVAALFAYPAGSGGVPASAPTVAGPRDIELAPAGPDDAGLVFRASASSPEEADDEEGAFTERERDLLDRLRASERERCALRAERQCIEIETGRAGAEDVIGLIRAQADGLAERDRELALLRSDADALRAATGRPDIRAAVAHVLELKTQLREQAEMNAARRADADALESELGASDAGAVIGLVLGLKGRVNLLERETASVAAERDRLLREFDAANPDAAVAAVRLLRDRVAAQTERIARHEAERAALAAELSASDPDAVIEEIRSLRRRLDGAYRSLAGLIGEVEAELISAL